MNILLPFFENRIIFAHFSLAQPKLNFRYLHKLLNTWSLSRCFVCHPNNYVLQVFGVPIRYSRDISLKNFSGQFKVTSCLKWRTQCNHFIEYTSQRPNIRFCVIISLLYLLRTHVIRCSNSCMCVLAFSRENAAQAEITKLHIVTHIEEHISRF